MTRLTTLLQRARAKSRETHESWAVVEMDHEDDRKLYAVPLDYCDRDFEFEAFDGRVIVVVEPDGLVDWCDGSHMRRMVY